MKIEILQQEIKDLNERLQAVYAMDNSIKNQEMITLKKNVSDALQVEFENYQDFKEEYNADNFEALSATLNRVFKILKRFDLFK